MKVTYHGVTIRQKNFRRLFTLMTITNQTYQTKPCDTCEAPVAVDGPKHHTSADHLQAQRKEIRRMRAENESLKGRCSEYERLWKARDAQEASGIVRGGRPLDRDATLEVPINEAGRVLKKETRVRHRCTPAANRGDGCLCGRPDFSCPTHG